MMISFFRRAGLGLPLIALLLLGGCGRPTFRVATFNVALHRDAPGALAAVLEDPDDAQVAAVIATIAAADADVILLNEFDHDPSGRALAVLRARLRAAGAAYPYVFTAPVNTGVPSGFDLDLDGATDGPGDAWGYGTHPGQYGMVVLSRRRIHQHAVRTFRTFRWSALPNALLPRAWYGAASDAMPLSSKAHWDVPFDVDGTVVHLLASHPTPPVFDGPEDRNGRRNHDEIAFWTWYLDARRAPLPEDDLGRRGGLAFGDAFVIVGDLNADPHDGESRRDAITTLLAHPRVQAEPIPESVGAIEAAWHQAGANRGQRGDPATDTADFDDERGPGNLRVDYVLPSRDLEWIDGGVHWPRRDAAGAWHLAASDHRLVWVDLRVPRARE